MTRTSGFLGDPNKRQRIRTLRQVRLMIVWKIIDTNVDMEGGDTKNTLKCIWNKH